MRVFLSIGDRSASNYIYRILKDFPKGFEFVGFTDERIESLGVQSVGKIEDLSVVGIVEVIPKILTIRSLFKRSVEELKRCDALIACDAPGFNLRLIKEAKKLKLKVIYFISPQVWAWKPSRAETLARYSDHLIVILPFEKAFYEPFSDQLKVHFVGHPLVDMAKPSLSREAFIKKISIPETFYTLMPGSRWGEIKRHTPLLKKVVQMISREEEAFFLVPTFDIFKDYLEDAFSSLPVKVISPSHVESPAYNSLAYSKKALIASGTASLEAGIIGTPHAVFYKVNPLTYFLGRLLVKVQFISLVNLISQKGVVPELINPKPETLVKAFYSIDETSQKENFKDLKESLGSEGVIDRLRDLFYKLLKD